MKLSILTNNFTVICIYRSPTGDFTHFLKQLESILNKIQNTSTEFILCGDFNIDYIKDSSKKYLLDSLLASFNLFSMIKFPTRIFKNSSTLIDNIYVNTYKFDFSVYPFINGLSDHDAQIIAFTDIFTSTPKQTFSSIRKIDSNTINTFVLRLSYENWENVFLEENVNVIFNNFLNTYLKIFYASFPIVKLKKSCKPKPWITKGIKVSCVKKRKLYLTYRNSNNPNHKEHYKKYCQILSKVITAAKKLYYNKLILRSNNKQKTAWKIIKTLTNNTKNTGNKISTMNINDTLSTNPIGTANAFNTYFTSVAKNLLTKNFSKRGSTNNNDPMIYL